MKDETEDTRRLLQAAINETTVENLPIKDRTWTPNELTEEFDVLGFMAPFVIVRRKDNGEKGSLMFKHNPRIYFGYEKK